MKTWTAVVKIEMPDDNEDKRGIQGLVSDTLGDEIYNMYGEGNAYVTEVLAGDADLLAHTVAVNKIHALLDYAYFDLALVHKIADVIESTGREVHPYTST